MYMPIRKQINIMS